MINIMDRGASPNASAEDNTNAIQAVLDTLPSNEQVLVPATVFKIAGRGLVPKSNTLIQLNGTLQLVTQPNEDYCRHIMLEGVDRVTVQGSGNLRGDRDVHVGDESMFGARQSCVELREGATNITLTGFSATNSWADGICFAPAPPEAKRCIGVTIDRVACNDNRRNGLSIIDGDTIHVKNSQFRRNGKGARATAPFLGIDIECGVVTDACQNIIVETSIFDNNGNTKHDGNISIGSPRGFYKNIYIAGSNTYDWRYQPIIVTGNGGKLGVSFVANLGKELFWRFDWYRYPGFPSEWKST